MKAIIREVGHDKAIFIGIYGDHWLSTGISMARCYIHVHFSSLPLSKTSVTFQFSLRCNNNGYGQKKF